MKIYADKWDEYAAIVRAWMGEEEELAEEELESVIVGNGVEPDHADQLFAVAWPQNEVNKL
jgi:hypothetical protein